ncbi:MAG: hypothetical protein HZC17_09995, partial [Candidatus Omnitrophica bacterium]|nr:hypothetical protein [Candidatus Omnitrophota bacterium]
QRDIDYYGSMPERIKIFEAEREKALKKYEDDTSRMERYVKEQREKFNAISKDYALNDQLKAFQEMDNLLSGWSALSGKATSARVQKIQEDINQLREEIKKAIEKTKADIKNYEEEQKRRLAEWQRQEAERIRLEEERKKKEAEEHGAGVLLGMELMNAKVGEHSEKDALGGNIRLMSGDLKNGAVELSAHLSSIENAESVSISLDGGGTWNEIQKNQEIRHSFVPTPKTPYKPAVKVKTTYGEKTLDMFPSGISILFEDVDFTKLVVEAMKKLSDAYEAKNAALFSELIANDFIGNKSTLEEGVRYDFDTFDSIRLQLYINRIEKRSNLYVVELKWNKSQMVRKSGKQQSLSGSTSMMFVYDDGKMKIKNLRGDLIYAALSPEIAESSGLSQAVIDNIRKARDTGTGAPPSPGQGDGGGLSSPAAGLEIGTFTLTQYKLPHPPEFDVEGYNFASKSKTRETFPYPVASDFRRREGWIEARTGGGGVIDLGSVGIDSVTEAPTSGYTGAMSGASGHVYAVQLANGTYALVETTSLSDIFTTPNTSTFKYKYQKDGTRSFK